MENSKIIFDSDCLSAFLWVDQLEILYKLFGGSIKIPQAVYKEIRKMKNSKFPFVYKRLETAIKDSKIEVLEIKFNSPEEKIMNKIKNDYFKKHKKEIGNGEAEMLALAKYHKAICIVKTASNNLRDVYLIARQEEIENITTIDIMCEAYKDNLKTLKELEIMKQEMVRRKRFLPKESIEYFLKEKGYLK